MTREFLEEYLNASSSERKIKEAVVGMTEAQIMRSYELQCFYDSVEKDPWRLQNISFGGGCALTEEEMQYQMSLMHITYSTAVFNPVTSSKYSPMMRSESKQDITLCREDYRRNERLFRALARWLQLQNQSWKDGCSNIMPIASLMGFTTEEAKKIYEEEKT